MQTQQIHAIAQKQGISGQALDSVTARVRGHFADASPSPAEAAAYIERLPVWDKLGMTQEAFAAMPGTWRMDQARRFEPPPTRRRPTTRELTPEELASLEAEGLPRPDYIAKARALQQTPAPE